MRDSAAQHASKHLIVVHWKDRMSVAYSLMHTKEIRHLPVIDDEKCIVGIISERDLQRAMRSEQPDFAPGFLPNAEFEPLSVVRDFMSSPVAILPETATVEMAAKIMIDKKISSLLITRNQEVVGILTTDDLLRALLQSTETVVGRAVSQLESAFMRSPIGPIAASLGNMGI